MYAITLTQPWATLCVAPLREPLTIPRPLPMVVPEFIREHVHTIPAGRPPKLNETRSFRPHAAAVGPRVVMHAGKGDAGMQPGLVRNGRLVEPYASAVRACGYSDIDPWGQPAIRRRAAWPHMSPESRASFLALDRSGGQPLPIGAAVGLVTFDHVEHTIRWAFLRDAGKTHALDFLLGNWDPPRFAWHMARPVLLPTPVPCRGMQMIWKTDEATDAAILVQGVE